MLLTSTDYSNGVARRVWLRAYNDVVLDVVDQLRGIDELVCHLVKAARLRAILAQLNESLNGLGQIEHNHC